jgi:hypothetical protein
MLYVNIEEGKLANKEIIHLNYTYYFRTCSKFDYLIKGYEILNVLLIDLFLNLLSFSFGGPGKSVMM